LKKGDILIARNEIQSDISLTNAYEYDIIGKKIRTEKIDKNIWRREK